MIYQHTETARCIFVVGPLKLYVCEAPPDDLRFHAERLQRYLREAINELEKEQGCQPDTPPTQLSQLACHSPSEASS